jgi:hypothetical protein
VLGGQRTINAGEALIQWLPLMPYALFGAAVWQGNKDASCGVLENGPLTPCRKKENSNE